jgi:hypothetical protein
MNLQKYLYANGKIFPFGMIVSCDIPIAKCSEMEKDAWLHGWQLWSPQLLKYADGTYRCHVSKSQKEIFVTKNKKVVATIKSKNFKIIAQPISQKRVARNGYLSYGEKRSLKSLDLWSSVFDKAPKSGTEAWVDNSLFTKVSPKFYKQMVFVIENQDSDESPLVVISKSGKLIKHQSHKAQSEKELLKRGYKIRQHEPYTE